MSTTNSDNSEMKVIRVSANEIEQYLEKSGLGNLSVSVVTFEEKLERTHDINTAVSGTSDANGAASDSTSSNASASTSSSGTVKANTEFKNDGIAFLNELLAQGVQILKVSDPERESKTHDERE